ncbi:hypothetical protein TL16_g01310 [Triparma laevis f. inornata]|uniref:Uncharacterized protein n=1 Tax=Triparma laevis f. inornata TaxID=1714386 RepID=A0A9W7DS59_9STRA|nr:hypothetical protein TL16_g01310 [Triparma laevis f. inornata]
MFLIDCDNTLYRQTSIESQIVSNIHQYCLEHYQISASKADSLHRSYGSTIEGLSDPATFNLSLSQTSDFYRSVYSSIDYHSLLPVNSRRQSLTGYSAHSSRNSNYRYPWLPLLVSLSKLENVTLCVSSNSPRPHVIKCLENLGLPPSIFWKILTPCEENGYVTKSSLSFYDPILADVENGSGEDLEIVVIDDSEKVLEVAKTSSLHPKIIKTYEINDENDLRDVLLQVQGCKKIDSQFAFDEVKYLKAKNVVDESAINEEVWRKLLKELSEIPAPFNTHLKIVDVGAGLLHMLRRFISQETGLISPESKVQSVEYHAYEGNVRLLPEIVKVMESLGFRAVTSSPPYTFFKEFYGSEEIGAKKGRWWNWRGGSSSLDGGGVTVTVYLHMRDFRDDLNANASEDGGGDDDDDSKSKPPDLIVGSCFADLFHPEDLIVSLKKIAKQGSPLLYFPITYGGMTTCSEMRPATDTTPSDARAFAIYNDALVDQGHNLDPTRIVSAIKKHGGAVLGLYNKDILARLGGEEETKIQPQREEDVEIVFERPRKVSTRRINPAAQLGNDEIEIESICSLISSGTELKVFRGDVDADSQVDVNIDDMKDETFGYPMTYGYCLVGKVVRCGAGVDGGWMGRNVFTFSPHSTRVVGKVDSVLLVPRDIDPYDAIFLPSVETALGLIHDAEFRVGERVGVVGQGLIGLLVTAILAKSGVDVTAFEIVEERAALAALLGARTVLDPRTDRFDNNLDCAVEVSGAGAGLQTAIDRVGDGGKIVIGSLYGVGWVELGLGIDFHRSGKVLVTSQVSEIPVRLQGRWSKRRRFDLAWDKVREIGVRRILGDVVRLDDAQDAYEGLESGKSVCVAFDLKNSRGKT